MISYYVELTNGRDFFDCSLTKKLGKELKVEA